MQNHLPLSHTLWVLNDADVFKLPIRINITQPI